MLTNFTKKIAYATTLLFVISMTTTAQTPIRNYTLSFSENLKGATTMFGNTVLNVLNANGTPNTTMMNDVTNTYGNDSKDMGNINVGAGDGIYNSSSSDLVLPAGTNTIRFARLYWGGRVSTSVSNDTLRKIKIRKGTSGDYFNATAAAANINSVALPSTTAKVYQAFVDITAFVSQNGGGTYTVGNVRVATGSATNGGNFGGWSIVVAYENPSLPYNSLRIYDGYAQVYNSGSATTTSIDLTGLNVPNNQLNADEAVMAATAWEGDANISGDFVKVNDFNASNATNPTNNFWNGSMTKNGVRVTTKNPNYNNSMGIDIDEVNVGQGFNIQPNATSVNVKFGTEQDQYFPSVFTFSIRMKDPTVTLDKTVTDADGNGFVDSNEELTYVLSGTNAGNGVAYNAVVIDTLPSNVTYVANSLQVVNGGGATIGMKTDAADGDEAFKGTNNGKTYVKFFVGTGATGTSGGQLSAAPNGDYSVRFKVKAAAIPGTVTNTARITANSQAGDAFTDDGTAIIGDNGGPLPVKLISFKASKVNSSALVTWVTASELNSDYFIVQRSDDGIHFTDRGRVNAHGTTNLVNNYQFNDPLNTNSQVVYYRLKSVDTDAKYGFSKTVAIRLNGLSVNNFSVYPNPFISDIKVTVTASADEMASFRIISFDGKEMMTRKVALQSGDNIVVLTNFGTIARGNYILEVTTSTDKFIKKIVKN